MNRSNFILLALVLLVVGLSGLLHYYWVAMEWKDIIMSDAVIIGPIFAVIITRALDDQRFTKERKLAIFRALVKDRSNPLSYDFVSAFNSIQIEFADDNKVVRAWKTLSKSRNAAGPAKDDHEGWARKIAEWNSKTDELLFEIANALNIKVNPFDIQASYIPVAWGNEQQTNSQLKSLLLELLNNKRSLNIRHNSAEAVTEEKATSTDKSDDPPLGK
jgi:hypothetical protein